MHDMKKLYLLLSVLWLTIAASAGDKELVDYANSLHTAAQTRTYYANPVICSDVADPTIIRWGDTYYVAGTSSEWAPYYPLFRSTDLVNWTQVGHIFNQRPEWTSSSFWAPELFIHQDKIYCYYTARSQSTGRSYIGVAVAEQPEGPYEDHGPLVDFGTEDIDAFVFDDDGQLYITWKAYGLDPRPIELLCCPLTTDGLHLDGEPVSLLVDEEDIGMEGQCIFREGDWYYLLYAARGCCGAGSDYEVRVARSEKVTGPFVPYVDNPILMGGEGEFQSCGHGTLVDTPDGRHYYLCHAYQHDADFYRGRQPLLQELFVGSDGWPHFKTGRLATVRQPMPFEGVTQMPPAPFEDSFDGETLRVEWTWNYPYCDVQARPAKGSLCLSGTSVGEMTSGAALCLRPFASAYEAETVVVNDVPAMKGLTFYGNDASFIVWGVEKNRLRLVCKAKGEEHVVFDEPCRSRRLWLRMAVREGCHLSFRYSMDGKVWNDVPLASLDGTSIMSWDRISRPGLYTTAPTKQPARFDYFVLK